MCILQKLAMSPSVQLSKTKVAEYDECSTKSYDSDHSEVTHYRSYSDQSTHSRSKGGSVLQTIREPNH